MNQNLSCPNCDSTDIRQYRNPTGPIWCSACGFQVNNKEVYNPFVIKQGRPTKYTADMPERAYRLALLGLTDEDMAAAFGINTCTLNEWKRRSTRFSRALNDGKLEADSKVAYSLYKRANGFEYAEKEYRLVEDQMVPVKVTKKHLPPDTKACTSWLYNRQRSLWKNARSTEISTPPGQPFQTQNDNTNTNHNYEHEAPVDLSQFTQEELELAAKMGYMQQPDEEWGDEG